MSKVETYDMKEAISENRMLGVWRSLIGLRLLYAGAIVSLIIATIARTAGVRLIGWFVDDILPREDLSQVVPLVALAFLGLSLLQGLFSYLSGRWAAETAEQLAWRMRNYLFDHLQRLTFTYHDRMQTGELIQRVTSDLDAVRRFIVEQSIGIGRIVFMFVVNFIGILFIDVHLSLLSIVVIPVLVVVSLYFFRMIVKKYEELQDQEARLSTTLQENLSGVRVVKAFARQQYESDKFEKANSERFAFGRQLLLMHSIYWPLTDLITGMQLVAGFMIGGIWAFDGRITIGEYVAYLGMVGLIIHPISQLGRLIVQASTGLVSYGRIVEILEQEREWLDEDGEPPVEQIKGDIVFDKVYFEYDDKTPVLHDISFRCKAGQTIALLGLTGSGKTSLVNLLPRFYEYTRGSITLDGIELKEYPRAFLRQNIGVVEQEPFLFSRTIRENITYSVGRDVRDEEVFLVAKAAAIHESIESFPEGYDTMVGERGVTLSGGQKQRVALARTLVKRPRILILDDAMSSVDTETEASIRSALREMMEDTTTFIIAHRIQTLRYADLILVFDEGRIVQMGTHDELVTQKGIYKRTHDMQSLIEVELEKELSSV